MKHQWLAYVVVGLLSVGAGVAIAGLPDNVPVDATIVAPTTTVAAEPTLPETTMATTTMPPTTLPETTAATTTTVASTTMPDSTEPDPPDSAPAELPDRSELFTIVANGANVSGAAARIVERLQAIGYTDIAPRNGTTIFEFTTIYFADGLDEAALRLAEDLELLPDFIAPLIDAPEVLDLPADVQLLAYIGIDRA